MEEEEKTGRIWGKALSGYDRADLLFDFAVAYADGANLTRDFGNGKAYSPAEVHMITRIAENPGITVTELARRGNRTKGAISQVVKRLEEKGLVEKRKNTENCSRTLLFATEEGRRLGQCHKERDQQRIEQMEKQLEAQVGQEALDRFYDVLAWMYEGMKQRRQRMQQEKCGQCAPDCQEDD